MIIAGDILVFKRNSKDIVSNVLSWILQRFEPDYDRKYWHTAPVTKVTKKGCYTLDAERKGAKENFYTFDYIENNCQVYHWFDSPISQKKIDKFVKAHLGDTYDIGAYVGTIFFYLIFKIFHKSYCIYDREQTCWELTSLFCRELGKPLQPIYEYPLISGMIRMLEGDCNG